MPPSFKKMKFREARDCLDSLCCKLDGKPASTNRSPDKARNLDGAREDWWTEHQGTCPSFDSARCKAYLQAYIEIAGPVFYGTGIPLERWLMHPDRAVMKAMLLAECVTLDKERGLFELTPKGKELIAGNP